MVPKLCPGERHLLPHGELRDHLAQVTVFMHDLTERIFHAEHRVAVLAVTFPDVTVVDDVRRPGRQQSVDELVQEERDTVHHVRRGRQRCASGGGARPRQVDNGIAVQEDEVGAGAPALGSGGEPIGGQ